MKHLKVSQKMMVLVITVIVMIIGIGVMGISTTGKMEQRSKETYQENLLPVSYVSQMRTNNRAIESFLLEQLLSKDAAAAVQFNDDINEKIKQNNDLLSQLKQIPYNDPKLIAKINEYAANLPDYRAQRQQIIELGKNNQKEEAYALFSGSFNASREKMIGLLKEVTQLLLDNAKTFNAESVADAKHFKNLSYIIISVVWVLCVGLSVLITRLITKPLKELRALMLRAEEGDLTVIAAYNSKDEIGVINRSFNTMLASLRTMMLSISESAEMLSASSQEMSASAEQTKSASQMIAETSGEIASGFEEQIVNIARTSEAVQAMSDDISSADRSSHEMSNLMSVVSRTTDHGAEAVSEIIGQMKEIDTSVSGIQVIVGNLAALSEEINTITSTINGIATQTNLLSLNASIEAARAGEQGRGFAVVAGEIRKLSEVTGKSSLQITDLITRIQGQTESALESMAHGSRLVSDGVAQSQLVSKAFGEIQTSIKDAELQTEEIRTAIEHISQESKGVTEAMKQVSEISNAGAEGVQDTSAASQEQLSAMEEMTGSAQYLATLAEELQKSLARFKL
ncbi:methyl-accepting chemotaxis protein [Paenibacillus sp. sgz500958]|uniref:methyl-accepting chemotaxis protein n=1 Tax=Paenibacillus sp. sgz500958 TaxID=3242475 RepID=UPI0036D37BF1